MHRFIRNVAVYFAFLFAFCFALDALVTCGLRGISQGSFAVHEQALCSGIDVDVAVFGSSRALANFDTPWLSRDTGLMWYNFGLDGEESNLHCVYVETYLQTSGTPRLLVYNIDPWSLGPLVRGYDNARYVPYLSNDTLYQGLAEIDPTIWKHRYVPMYRYVGRPSLVSKGICGALGLERLVVDEHRNFGFRENNRKVLEPARTTEWLRKREPESWYVYLVRGPGQQYVERMVSSVSARSIPMVFVVSPIWEGRRQYTENESEVLDCIREICVANGIVFYNYSNDTQLCDGKYFADAVHLNAEGARLFSEVLLSDLIRDGVLMVPAASTTRK